MLKARGARIATPFLGVLARQTDSRQSAGLRNPAAGFRMNETDRYKRRSAWL